MIKVIYNSEVVGTFSKLTLVFRYYYKKLDKVFNEEEVQVAFLLEEGILNTEILHQLTKGTALSSPRYTIKFTLKDKDYFINRGAFDCIQSGVTFKNLSSYKRIEGVGELVNPKEFPIHLLDRNVLVVNNPDWVSPLGDTTTDILQEKLPKKTNQSLQVTVIW